MDPSANITFEPGTSTLSQEPLLRLSLLLHYIPQVLENWKTTEGKLATDMQWYEMKLLTYQYMLLHHINHGKMNVFWQQRVTYSHIQQTWRDIHIHLEVGFWPPIFTLFNVLLSTNSSPPAEYS